MRVGAFAFIRLIVMLRRIWKTLDHIAAIESARLQLDEQRIALDYPEWRRAGNKMPDAKKARKAAIGVMDVDELNKKWREEHPNYE